VACKREKPTYIMNDSFCAHLCYSRVKALGIQNDIEKVKPAHTCQYAKVMADYYEINMYTQIQNLLQIGYIIRRNNK
jgi:hypothetical protein